MTIDTFNFDADGANVVEQSAFQLSDGNKIIKVKFNTGFVLIYTKASTGFKNMDFSHELIKDDNGYYHADMEHPKSDFHDYFPN